MTVGWLRPAPASPPDPLDDTASLIDELRTTHRIEIIDESRAHDLVWRHARQPFDRLVHELADSRAHAFVSAYAVHFPGILLLRAFGARHARAIRAARLVVVGDAALADSLSESYQPTRFVHAPIGVPASTSRDSEPAAATSSTASSITCALLGTTRRGVLERAVARARAAGAGIEILTGRSDDLLRRADIIAALSWPPPAGPPVAALAAIAAGKPTIVLETLVTAGWPAFDPQTWLPRGSPVAGQTVGSADPICVSLDPRDEEHSLVLALRRLAADPALRAQLGQAARTWWRGHATIAHAAAAWRCILSEPDLPISSAAASADGSEHARSVLAEFGVTVDFL